MRKWIAWALVVPFAVWTVGRVFGLERGYPLVPLMAFTPYVAGVAVVVAIAVVVLRAWAPAAVAGVLAVALVGCVAPRALGGPSHARGGDGPVLRIVSANVRRGGADPASIVALAAGADVLSLQELTPRELERLEDRGLRESLPYAVVHAAPGANGTALFARFPLREEPALERFVAATADVEGVPVELQAVHPPAPVNDHSVTVNGAALDALPAAGRGPVRLLVGDFNATLDHAPVRRLLGRGYEDAAEQLGEGLKPTWPTGGRNPGVTIDHVIADARCGFRAYDTIRVPHTDHRTITATVVLPRAA